MRACSGVGPALNTTEWINLITQIQTIFLEEGLQMPVVYGLDSVHGANYVYGATLFPQQISTRSPACGSLWRVPPGAGL